MHRAALFLFPVPSDRTPFFPVQLPAVARRTYPRRAFQNIFKGDTGHATGLFQRICVHGYLF